MITIKNKRDSIIKIKELGLNTFPIDIFGKDDISSFENFMKKYPSSEYVLRTPQSAMGKFAFCKDLKSLKEKLKIFDDEVIIQVSFNPYKDDVVLLGDVKMSKSGEIVLTARTDGNASHRNIYDDPQYSIMSTLEDDKVWSVPGFSTLAQYISDHELYDVIVEFIIYDRPIGTNNEKVIITELRTEY